MTEMFIFLQLLHKADVRCWLCDEEAHRDCENLTKINIISGYILF